ncbi:MAG: acetolactate synthase small subunit [Microthrixaceae bacterium]
MALQSMNMRRAGSRAPRHHVLSVLVENRTGVLARVSSLFARRGYNIYSLAVAPTDDERFSRITVVVDVENAPLEQIVKQLNKLIHVIKISELDPRDSIERELMMVTVKAPPAARSEIIELIGVFGGRIIDVGHDELMLSLDEHPERLDDLEQLLAPYGIIDLQRTGRVALPKLERSPGAGLRSAG